MQSDRETIRHEIDRTRERVEDTVEALAYKTDVPARTKDAVNDRVESVKQGVARAVGAATNTVTAVAGGATQRLAGAGETVTSLRDQVPSTEATLEAVRRPASAIARNPLGLAVGSVATGFLIGLMLPVSDVERERIGPLGEDAMERAKAGAASVVEQGANAMKGALDEALTRTPNSSSPTI